MCCHGQVNKHPFPLCSPPTPSLSLHIEVDRQEAVGEEGTRMAPPMKKLELKDSEMAAILEASAIQPLLR